MMFNILTLFSWTTWFLITIIIILIFWVIYGGKHEYEFVGVKPLSTKTMFQNLDNIHESNFQGKLLNMNKHNLEPPKLNPVIPTGIKNGKTKDNTCKGEDLVHEILEHILACKVKRNVRPAFLRNPETGKSLELDCYSEDYAIAVEYNGIQHYKYPSAFHKTEQEFYDQLYRDRLKRKLCDDNGVYLISIPYWVDNYGSEEGHLIEKTGKKKYNFVPREVKYQRIYDYLYPKVKEYFEMVFPENPENEELEEDDEEMYDYEDDENEEFGNYEDEDDEDDETEEFGDDEDEDDDVSQSEVESFNGIYNIA